MIKLQKDKWEIVRLEDLCQINIGKTPSRNNLLNFGKGYTWLSISDFNGEKYISNSKEEITDFALKEANHKIIKENTVLLTFKLTIGKLAITGKPLYTNEAIASLPIRDENVIGTNFLFTVLQTVDYNSKTDKAVKGATLNKEKLKDLPIPLPPLEEQKQIAALFQSIETAMEQVDGQEKNLKALRKSLINKLTKQKPKFGNLLTKSNYKVYSIGDLAVEVTDRTDNPPKTGIEKFIGLEDFESGELTIQRFSSTEKLVSAMKLCKKGDVLFARRNAYLKRASLTDFDAVCSGDVIVMRAKEKIILPKFLILIMNTDEFWEFAISNAAGTMSKRVKWRDLAAYSLELPDIKIQEKILEVFNQLEATLTQLKQQKTTLKNLKQKLLNEILG